MSITLGEIRAQYRAIRQTHRLLCDQRDSLVRFLREANPQKLIFTGCGSSFLLSCSMRAIASMRLDIPVYAVAAGDLWLNCGRYEKMLDGALLVSLSRSGLTSEVLRAIEAMRAIGTNTRTLSIICAEDTELARQSDFALSLPWAYDKSVCQTRCVGNLYAAGAMLIACMAQDEEIFRGIAQMAEVGDDYIHRLEPVLQSVAAEDWETGVVLADAELDGIAEEAALTFKEISQCNSNYYHILDSRHGPMVMIGKKTLVVVAMRSPLCSYEAALVEDVLKKDARVVCCSQEPIDIPGALCLNIGARVGDVAAGLGLVTVCQLVTYFKSGFVGCDPDRPDGLDAWISIQ